MNGWYIKTNPKTTQLKKKKKFPKKKCKTLQMLTFKSQTKRPDFQNNPIKRNTTNLRWVRHKTDISSLSWLHINIQ